jgi:RNA polymerase sigma factor (sigma-70 family)
MIVEEQLSVVETASRAAWQRGDFQAAATLVLEGYGAELYSFLAARTNSLADADDAFCDFGEDLWKALPKFEWRCSARAWCFKLARSAASRLRGAASNRRDRRVPLSAVPWLDAIIDSTRTSTQPHLRTDVKDEFQKLRDQLSPEDRDLLILRIDRNLSWREVAHAMLDADDDDVQLRRAEAALRQRFVEVKARLRSLATEAGLL